MRSAAFSIGVLQALEKARGGKPNFDLLSTVSGGGFAGAWYRALLRRRAAEGKPLTEDALTEAIGELKKSGGYLNVGHAELLLVYLGRLLLFWSFAVPALWTVLLVHAAAALGLEWLVERLAASLAGQLVLAGALIAGICLALSKWGRQGIKWLSGLLAALVAAHLLVFPPEVWGLALLPAAGLPAAALAWAARSSRLAHLTWLTRYLGRARMIRLAAWLCIGLLILFWAWVLAACQPIYAGYLEWVSDWRHLGHLPGPLALIPLLGIWALLAGLMRAKWVSLAEFYRERIRVGFLEEREEHKQEQEEEEEKQEEEKQEEEKQEEKNRTWRRIVDALRRIFKGREALTLRGLGLVNEVDSRQSPPLLIVNAAASIDERAHREWDERKAAAFAWTPEGYIDLRNQQTPKARFGWPPVADDVAVDLAVATSAAVAGPRMGSYTARPIGFLLSFLNIRLGQWFDLRREPPFEPTGSLWGLVCAELLGTRWRRKPATGGQEERRSWIHLTDGGHFENLGLYEVVRRRYRRIVVVDASCDPEYRFSDLANAVRKIRIDLEVDIEINGLGWTEKGTVLKSQRQRVYGGTVRYPGSAYPGGAGQIVYVKAALIGDEPADVAGYAELHPEFPHESTTDQWFSESQFESYRRLGQFTIESALQNYDDAKQLFVSKLRPEDKGGASADVIVTRLKEAGILAGRRELRPTHGGAVVCYEDGSRPRRYLLVKSTEGDQWVLPKGGVERAETPFECARRELLEEAGIEWPVVRQGQPGVEPWKPKGVILERYRRGGESDKSGDSDKGGEEVRVFYYTLALRSSPSDGDHREDPVCNDRTKDREEEREEIWVTLDEYARELRQRQAERQADGKETLGARRPLAEPSIEELNRTPVEQLRRAQEAYHRQLGRARLRAARVVIPELWWILKEAERQVSER